MSEEILENTSEEIADETAEESTYASSEEISSEEEQVIEENSKPRTKAGMVKAIYDQLNTLKKAELSDSYESIIGATLAEQDEDDDDKDKDEDEEGWTMGKGILASLIPAGMMAAMPAILSASLATLGIGAIVAGGVLGAISASKDAIKAWG